MEGLGLSISAIAVQQATLGSTTPADVAWGDGTQVTWGDGTKVDWSSDT